jgi:hypothetical protein
VAKESMGKRPGGLLKKPDLLVCDQFRAHITEGENGS